MKWMWDQGWVDFACRIDAMGGGMGDTQSRTHMHICTYKNMEGRRHPSFPLPPSPHIRANLT
jgi:hypothetical protein